MTLRSIGLLCAAVLAFGLLASAGAGARAHRVALATASAGSHLQVTQVEYRLILSRGSVRAGLVGLEAIDRGMDPHDLRLREAGSRRELTTPQLTPGQRWDGLVYLHPGRYLLWCSLPEHARLGMHATLTVTR